MTISPDSIAIDLLAWQDAVFAPVRGEFPPESNLGPVAVGFRLNFEAAGIPYRPRSKDPTEQRADQRAIDALAEAGAAIVYRGRSGRATAVRLLEPAEEAARFVCGLPGVDDSLLAMQEIANCEAEGLAVECRGMRLVSESTIEGVAYGAPEARERFATLRDFLFPALARGWVESHSTVAGHVFYGLTDAGRSILAQRAAPAKARPFIATAVALRAYDEAYGHARQMMRGMTPDDVQEIGPMPLPRLPIPTQKGVRATG